MVWPVYSMGAPANSRQSDLQSHNVVLSRWQAIDGCRGCSSWSLGMRTMNHLPRPGLATTASAQSRADLGRFAYIEQTAYEVIREDCAGFRSAHMHLRRCARTGLREHKGATQHC